MMMIMIIVMKTIMKKIMMMIDKVMLVLMVHSNEAPNSLHHNDNGCLVLAI